MFHTSIIWWPFGVLFAPLGYAAVCQRSATKVLYWKSIVCVFEAENDRTVLIGSVFGFESED